MALDYYDANENEFKKLNLPGLHKFSKEERSIIAKKAVETRKRNLFSKENSQILNNHYTVPNEQYISKISKIMDDSYASYDRPEKNRYRNLVIQQIKFWVKHNFPIILTLETSEWLFVKAFDENKFQFVVYQNDKTELSKMVLNKPKNVTIVDGNVNHANIARFDAVYLDFCCSYVQALEDLRQMLPVLKYSNTKFFAFTISSRTGARLRDIDIEFIKNNLNSKLPSYFKLIHEPYKYHDNGHTTMYTFTYQNEKLSGRMTWVLVPTTLIADLGYFADNDKIENLKKLAHGIFWDVADKTMELNTKWTEVNNNDQ